MLRDTRLHRARLTSHGYVPCPAATRLFGTALSAGTEYILSVRPHSRPCTSTVSAVAFVYVCFACLGPS
jgi:hypothetical protein